MYDMLTVMLSLIGAVFAVWQLKRSRNDFVAQRKAAEKLSIWIHKSDVHLQDPSQALSVTSIGTATTPSSTPADPKSNVIFIGYQQSHPDSDHQLGLFQEAAELAKAYRVEAQRLQTKHRTDKVLQVWSAVLPARINNEDLGDYLEDIHQRIAAGQSRWIISLRIVAAVFWTATDTIRYFFKAIGRSKSTN